MIAHVTGDLLDFPHGVTVIAQGCNTTNTFGSGLAKAIRERYPAAYVADTVAFKDGDTRLGQVSVADVGDGRRVINLYQQSHYGRDGKRYLDYEGLYAALTITRTLLEGTSHVLGVPHMLGCGLAGGDWIVVSAMLTSVFALSPVRCVIVKLPDNPPVS